MWHLWIRLCHWTTFHKVLFLSNHFQNTKHFNWALRIVQDGHINFVEYACSNFQAEGWSDSRVPASDRRVIDNFNVGVIKKYNKIENCGWKVQSTQYNCCLNYIYNVSRKKVIILRLSFATKHNAWSKQSMGFLFVLCTTVPGPAQCLLSP